MARYPDLPFLINITQEETRKVYQTLEKWGAALINQLDLRDQEIEAAPTTNIYTVVTVTNIGRPKGGDIAYSASSGKFKGYVSTAASTTWKDFN
jgi:hypothetical protein|tara:strand:+ start:84 stop:365 length:282 start_codon:yes stop_codon:yes gene_type:complete